MTQCEILTFFLMIHFLAMQGVELKHINKLACLPLLQRALHGRFVKYLKYKKS